jgi:glycosyltransferase involved in cell wall biosynthesis
MAHKRPDVALVFNGANAPWLPFLRMRGVPVATHVDGLEWKRSKWGPAARRYYKATEPLCVRWSDAVICDAQGIAEHYRGLYAAESDLISYGAPQVVPSSSGVSSLALKPGSYHLVVARFEPENHVAEIVEGYAASRARKPLVVVGDAPYGGKYIARVRSRGDGRVRFLGSVWDQSLLDQLYANCYVYWHGHSVGGTNPSLLRAIGAGAATNAYDVVFNREVLRGSGHYWGDVTGIKNLVEASEADADNVAQRGRQARVEAMRYDWDDVARSYERLCQRLALGNVRTGYDSQAVEVSEGRRAA